MSCEEILKNQSLVVGEYRRIWRLLRSLLAAEMAELVSNSFGAISHLQLRIELFDMPLDRSLAEDQVGRYLAVSFAFQQEAKHFGLARREPWSRRSLLFQVCLPTFILEARHEVIDRFQSGGDVAA